MPAYLHYDRFEYFDLDSTVGVLVDYSDTSALGIWEYMALGFPAGSRSSLVGHRCLQDG